jgi:carboxymethylenebutenolidase
MGSLEVAMDREGLLTQMRLGRQELMDVLANVPKGQLTNPVLPNQWSVKDLLAHIGFWERRAIDLYHYFQGGPAPDPQPGSITINELNDRVYRTNRGLALEELRQFESSAYDALFRLASSVPEADLFDPHRFLATEGNPFADWIVGNAFGHYADHLPDLRAWLGMPGWIAYQANGKSVRAYSAHPPQGGPGVIVLHAWWGLNPFFIRLCDRLAAEGFTALAPDLNDGKLATTVDEAKTLMEARDLNLQRSAVLGAVEQLKRQPGLSHVGMGVIGFSMGAAWSVILSAERAADITAVVLFYGTETVNISKTQAAYLGHFAEKDDWEPPEGVHQMESALHSAGREAKFYTYPKTGHWFFEDDRADAYEPQAAKLAWERTLAFLKLKLRD